MTHFPGSNRPGFIVEAVREPPLRWSIISEAAMPAPLKAGNFPYIWQDTLEPYGRKPSRDEQTQTTHRHSDLPQAARGGLLLCR